MSSQWEARTQKLIGAGAVKRLNNSKVTIFGLGGVGGFVLEALARAGVGEFRIVDFDTISETNKNRQIIATDRTIGQKKTDAAEERVKSINSSVMIKKHDVFVSRDNIIDLIGGDENFIVDCVDNVTAKIAIIDQSKKLNLNIISSMGTGNKLDPFSFKICDIEKTSVCPLAKVMRKELRLRGLTNITVLFSDEQPAPIISSEEENERKYVPASISYMPSTAGLMIASYVIRKIITI